MPRTLDDIEADFAAVRKQRDMADALRAKGLITERRWQQGQNILAGKDRRYFAEAETTQNPLLGVPMLGGAIPLDYAARKLGWRKGRSDATLAQVGQGYAGIKAGLYNWLGRRKGATP